MEIQNDPGALSRREHFKVKPPAGGSKTATDGRYCVFDDAHEDYIYTQAWVDKLIQELQSKEGYRTVLGKEPIAK